MQLYMLRTSFLLNITCSQSRVCLLTRRACGRRYTAGTVPQFLRRLSSGSRLPTVLAMLDLVRTMAALIFFCFQLVRQSVYDVLFGGYFSHSFLCSLSFLIRFNAWSIFWKQFVKFLRQRMILHVFYIQLISVVLPYCCDSLTVVTVLLLWQSAGLVLLSPSMRRRRDSHQHVPRWCHQKWYSVLV